MTNKQKHAKAKAQSNSALSTKEMKLKAFVFYMGFESIAHSPKTWKEALARFK